MKYTFIFMTPGNSFPGYLSETFKYVLDKILKLLFLLPNRTKEYSLSIYKCQIIGMFWLFNF